METLEAIKTRRSVRNYKGWVLDISLISEIIEYWLYAPSAHNQQAWKYYIISKKEDRIFLSETMEFGKMLPNAWWCVLACFDNDNVRGKEFIQQDMWASIQNILLAAHEKWVWTVRLWLYPHEEPMNKILQHFNLLDNITPFAIISMWIQQCELPEKNLKSEWKIEII
jgi:nitroreductase